MSEQQMTGKTHKVWDQERLRVGLFGTAALFLFIVFSTWSGVPTGERALIFWIGVAVLVITLGVFGMITWHFLFRPLPAGQTIEQQPIKANYRQALALLLGVGQLGMTVGAFWDEIWHRQYGIPFGEDFFWRPHLLMYLGMTIATALGFAGLYLITRHRQGTLQQRFRANPVVGLLVLVGAFLLYALPADPLWHTIYGEDLTAWSVPHLLLFVSFESILLMAAAIHMTTQPPREWGTLRQLRVSDALPLLMFTALSLNWNQFFTTEWDGTAGLVAARPEWLLPVMIAGGAALVGVTANHTLRMSGAATLTGLLALILRVALIQLFKAENMMLVNAWALALPPLLLIDLWYVYRRGVWAGAGAAATVGMGIVLLTIFRQFYPLAPLTNLPITLVMVLAGSLGMSWLGATLGDYFAERNKQVETDASRLRLPLASLDMAGVTVILIIIFAAFIVFFVTTATPPVPFMLPSG
jgi:drug/metabolite transporter (DMT)-like permease